jgi:hypothetical protein
MLFNELYYMTDGGTVWTDSQGGLQDPINPPHPLHPQVPSQSIQHGLDHQ